MSGAKILVVEDEWLVAQGIKESLQDLGYEVVGLTASGEEALRLAAETPPDLVVMDILLQGDMDGIQAAEHLYQNFEVPVVFLTAYADPQTLERAKVTEPFGYILKPFEMRELRTAVEIALYKSRAEKRLQHINTVLRAIRNVNQLIVREKDRDLLIREACQLLSEGRGYTTAWIALVAEGGKATAGAAVGVDYNTTQLLHMLLQGELPPCGRRVWEQGDLVVLENLASVCGGCSLQPEHEDKGALVIPLAHEAQVYGVLGVVVPAAVTRDEEELSLFRELAADLGLALYKIDLQEREQQAGKELSRYKDHLEELVAERTAALAVSEARYRAIFEGAALGIVLRDQDGNILAGNPAYQKILGYGPEELSQLGWSFLHPDDAPLFLQKFQELAEGRRDSFTFENRAFHKDGHLVWGRVKVSRVRGKDEQGWYALSLIEDITAEKYLQAKINHYQQRLRALAAELTMAEERERRHLAVDLHDHIGQVLALTQIKLGALKQELTQPEIIASLDEIRGHISQVIDTTRSLTLELGFRVLDELGLEAGIEWLGDKYQEQHGLKIEVDCQPLGTSLGSIEKTFLFRVVRELLTNVVKHAEARQVKISLQEKNHELELRVSDDGIGMMVSDHAVVNGFGLFSIAERMANLGGHMNIESVPGQGSQISITLPLQ